MSRTNPRGYRQGAIYRRASDGLWVGSIELPTGPKGQRRRKVITAKTEAAAKTKLNSVKVDKEKTGDLPTSSQTLESWLNVWYATIAVKKIRPKTAATYRTLIERHIIPTIGNVQLLKLTPAHIRRVEEAIVGAGLSSTTAMQAHRILVVAITYAEREGRVLKNVARLTDSPRRAVTTLGKLSAPDAVKVIRAQATARLGSRVAAALFTGARQGELLGLEIDRVSDVLDLSWQLQRFTWEHGHKGPCGAKRASECPTRTVTMPADFEARYLTGGLWLTRPKSEAGWRIIPLVDPLRSIIYRRIEEAATEPNPFGLVWTSGPKMIRGRRDYYPLDGSPIDPSTDNHYWHAALDAVDVDQVRLHDARHTTASLLLAANVRRDLIPKILGHSSYVTSQGYMDVELEQLREAMVGMSSLLQLAPTSGDPLPSE